MLKGRTHVPDPPKASSEASLSLLSMRSEPVEKVDANQRVQLKSPQISGEMMRISCCSTGSALL